jgi:hypothetical protein
MTARDSYNSSINSAETVKAESINTGQKSYQASLDSANAAYAAGGSFASFQTSVTSANVAFLKSRDDAERAKQASLALARDTLRTSASGDKDSF